MSRRMRASVVFPLEEQPEMLNTSAFISVIPFQLVYISWGWDAGKREEECAFVL